jgi:hypothetical protein
MFESPGEKVWGGILLKLGVGLDFRNQTSSLKMPRHGCQTSGTSTRTVYGGTTE